MNDQRTIYGIWGITSVIWSIAGLAYLIMGNGSSATACMIAALTAGLMAKL